MLIIKIKEDKFSDMKENAEKMLRYGGKFMNYIDEMERESERTDMGERNHMGDYRSMGMRGGGNGGSSSGGNGGYRTPYDHEQEMREREIRDRIREEEMAERRGMIGAPRYSRY